MRGRVRNLWNVMARKPRRKASAMRIGTRRFIGGMVMSIGVRRFIAAPGMRHRARLRAAARLRVMTHAPTRRTHRLASDMYNMLAHSAVLDDNSGAPRQPARVALREATALPSPRASDAPNWNSDLSQRRVTDTPSQFSK
jgi:hypothetical protein